MSKERDALTLIPVTFLRLRVTAFYHDSKTHPPPPPTSDLKGRTQAWWSLMNQRKGKTDVIGSQTARATVGDVSSELPLKDIEKKKLFSSDLSAMVVFHVPIRS